MTSEMTTPTGQTPARPTVWLVVFAGPFGQFFDIDGLVAVEAMAPRDVQVRAMSVVAAEEQVWFEMVSGRPVPLPEDAGHTQLAVPKGVVAGLGNDAVWTEVAGADVLIADPMVLTVIRWRWHALGMEPVRWTVLAPGASSSTVVAAADDDAVGVVVVDQPPSTGAPSLPEEFRVEADETWRVAVDVGSVVVEGAVEGDDATGGLVDRVERGIDEDVQFTVYKPPTITPGVWYSMLAFAHKTELIERPDGTVFDPVVEMGEKAAATLGEAIDEYARLSADAAGPLPRGDEIRFVPEVPGIVFNPPLAAFRWEEPVHMCEFRLRADLRVGGEYLRGAVSVFLGPLIIGRVTLSFRIAPDSRPNPEHRVARAGNRYRKIFPSYSHRDTKIVEEVRRAVETLGDRYSQDVVALRSGEEWGPRLEELIEEAHVFQLFWSSNSMRSEFVRREWTHALALHRSGFVRPLYWELPRPESHEEGLPPPELDQIHFSILPGVAVQESRVRCPTCHQLNPVDATFCFECGFALIGLSRGQDRDRILADPPTAPIRPPVITDSIEDTGERPVLPAPGQQQEQPQAGWRSERADSTINGARLPASSAGFGLLWWIIAALAVVALTIGGYLVFFR